MERLGPFEDHPTIAVAVSGGADSMALLHLIAEWAKAQGGCAMALTIDHGLRPEAADEARQVAVWAAALGVQHHAIVWQTPEPDRGALQARAREARYELLSRAAAKLQILHIATAHHADDQAETLLMRAARESGPDGLAGMPAITELPDARLLRPLLTVRKARLIATCKVRGQDWIEDLSNRDRRFERVRVREDEHNNAAQLLADAPQRAVKRNRTEAEVLEFLARHAVISPDGTVGIAWAPWRGADGEIKRRSLMQAIRMVGGKAYSAKLAQQQAMIDRLDQDGFRQTTLGGALITKSGDDLLISQEKRGVIAKKSYSPHYPLGPGRFPVV